MGADGRGSTQYDSATNPEEDDNHDSNYPHGDRETGLDDGAKKGRQISLPLARDDFAAWGRNHQKRSTTRLKSKRRGACTAAL